MNLNNKYNNKRRIVAYSLMGTLVINGLFSNFKNHYIDEPGSKIEFVREICLDDLKALIYSSFFLNDEEKDYLYNEDFLSDILPFINASFFTRFNYQKHFTNVIINNYGMDDEGSEFLGYYSSTYPNRVNIRSYDELNEHKDTLAHEFVHLCQKIGSYNLITEACAEIISCEYFPNTRIDTYTTQVKLVKKLMEIIGPYPLWVYNFTNNFALIEAEVKPYLTIEEYDDFITCLSFSHGDDVNNKRKFARLEELLSVLYKNKYNDEIENNEAIQVIDDSTAILTRYYFNKRFINQDNSFYYWRYDVEFGRIDYQTAMDRNLFYAYAIKHESISYESAMEAIKNGYFTITRVIDFKANDIRMYYRKDSSLETIIDATIDGVYYENASVDDLASEGILKVDYYRVYLQVLTAQEYLNQEYMDGATVHILYSKDNLTLYDDYIEGYIPKIHYLKPVSNINKSRVLKKD